MILTVVLHAYIVYDTVVYERQIVTVTYYAKHLWPHILHSLETNKRLCAMSCLSLLAIHVIVCGCDLASLMGDTV